MMMVSTVDNDDVENAMGCTRMIGDNEHNDNDNQIITTTSSLANATQAITITITSTPTRDVSPLLNNNDGNENGHEAEPNGYDQNINLIVSEIDSTVISGLTTTDNDEAHDDNDNNDAGKIRESDVKTPTYFTGFVKSIVSTHDNEDSNNNNNGNSSSNSNNTEKKKQISKQVVVEHVKDCTDPNALHYKHQVKHFIDEPPMVLKDRNQKIIEETIPHHLIRCHSNTTATTPGAYPSAFSSEFPIIPEMTTNSIDINSINDAYSRDSNPITDAYLATDDQGREEEQEGMTIVHAIPWTESSSSFTSNKKSNQKQITANRCKNKYVWIWSLAVLPILLCCMIFAAICGSGRCQKNKNDNSTNNNNSTGDDMINEPIVIDYVPFLTKDELLMAVDEYLSPINMTALEQKYGTISDWDVSKVNDFSHLFSGRRNSKNRQFNADISKWDVSSATTMSQMFRQAGNFTGDISNWNVSNVINMNGFMSEATFFNSNLSKWNTSQFRDVSDMFYWVSNFAGNGVQNWDVSSVTNMSGLFKSCDRFDANLSKWDVSRVRDMYELFAFTRRYRGIGIDQWNTSSTENMNGMFGTALSFNSNLTNWNVDKCNDMSYMFYEAPIFQGNGVESWNTSHVQSMQGMFYKATSFDANLSRWDISNVVDTFGMFSSATSFRGIGIEDWDTSRIEIMTGMFQLTSLSFHANFSKWNTSRVKDFSYMFFGASSLTQEDFSIDYNNSFQGIGLEQWNTEAAEDMSHMFYKAKSFDANLSNWNTSKVIDLSYMFTKATSFRGIGVGMWNTNRVITMEQMFSHATQFDANLSQWNVSQVENMEYMFSYATSFIGNGIQDWNVANVNTSAFMFASAISLDVNLSQWDMSRDANKTGMFDNTTLHKNVWWLDDDDNILQ